MCFLDFENQVLVLKVETFWMQIFDLFDVKRKGVIDFGDFVRSLNVFHPNAPEEDKIDCELKRYSTFVLDYIRTFAVLYVYICTYYLMIAYMAVSFKLYDLDSTGFIERHEVFGTSISSMCELKQ